VNDGGGVNPGRRAARGILLVDVLALLLVVASGPATYVWLDQSHPSPIAAGPNRTPVASASPGASGAAGSPGIGSPAPSSALIVGDGAWARTGSLPQAIWAAASVVLHDGRVMVVGGTSSKASDHSVATASIFDTKTGRWIAVTPMLQPRTLAMAVTLADGSVLVAGGLRDGLPLDTAERYIPETGTWVAAGRLNLPRTQGTLTLLDDGRVLAAGGGIEGSPGWTATASAEMFDPRSGSWSIVAAMSVARANGTATLLRDGTVLVTGGSTTFEGQSGKVTAVTEIYSPKLNSWRKVASMSKPRYAFGATLLQDGRVLVAGGWYAEPSSDHSHNTAEIYDPTTAKWTAAATMATGLAQYSLVGLRDGRVLALGGVDSTNKIFAASELYDPASGLWTAAAALAVPAILPAVQVLADGRVLVAGGALSVAATKTTTVCEMYSPAPR